MKKILAIILAFLTSLSNSTDYVAVSDKEYTENYYKINSAESPDYREYYGNLSSTGADVSCKTTNYSAQGKKVEGSQGYWFVNNSQVTQDMLKDFTKEHCKGNDKTSIIDYYMCEDCFTDGSYIIMPYSGTLQCDSKTNDCSTMTLFCDAPNGQQYKLIINGMKCWYCDVGKSEASTYHNSDEQKGKKFLAGNVLGVATSETFIKVIPINNGKSVGTCTLKQFYKGKFKKFD